MLSDIIFADGFFLGVVLGVMTLVGCAGSGPQPGNFSFAGAKENSRKEKHLIRNRVEH